MAITITGDSPEAIAYALMRDILAVEGKLISGTPQAATEAAVLGTYSRCLAAVREGMGKPKKD